MSSAALSSSRAKLSGKMGKPKVVAPRNPKLVRNDVEEVKQTPSAFMAEMALSTDERFKQTHEMRLPQIIELLDMSETTHQKFTMLDIQMPLFQPFPSEIVFQNYEPFETYTVPLNLRNNDKVARLVKVTQTDSPYFQIISPADVGHKVAPGMDTMFAIKFTPDEKRDYSHELICITEREKFIVPVRAIGARAILDFPDDVNFQTCPVKYISTKTLLVRNVGNRSAKFKLLTDSPFKASPDSCVLGVAESIQVDITFQPLKTGDFESNMVISYDTGENVYVTLYGISTDINVRLDKNSLKLENTFITSASQRTVSITNRSDVIVHFQWKPLATLAEEQQQKQRFYQELSYREEEQKESFLEECIADPTLRDKLSLVTRSFKNRMKVAEGEKMLYSDDVVSIDPVEGDIWPNSHADINIVFKPDEAKSYARTVYCDVTGRESRLPLRIRGDGVGSKIKFSFDTLDIEKVFVNSEHSYEVVVKNVGDIDAVFSYKQSESLFGQQFDFSPSQGIIVPGGYQAIQIHFTSPYLGEFSEEFVWTVEGSPEKFKFGVRGCVIGPTFHFDIPKLNFNTVSYGFTHVAACRLINTSLIPMEFYLRVPSDGTGHLASSIAGSFLSDAFIDESQLHQPPKEFEIYPNTGVLAPQTEVEIQVNLTSLAEQTYETYLVVDVEAVGKEILSLPIFARSIVPEICVETPIIDYGRCFIRYPYEKMVVLKNETDLPAKYELLPQITEDRQTIRYSTLYAKGIIQPQSIIEIPLQITAHGMERLTTTAYFMTYGCSDIPLQVQLTCIGEGPVVHVSPLEIDYGAIPVLEDATRHITISNESLIPAEFFCDMVRPNSLFSVEPERGVLAAERSATLTVTARLDDCLRFQDKLKITVTDGQLHTVMLSGHGTGTTIVSEPQMAPSIDIGATFSNLVCTRRFRLYNRGRRSQQIFWSTEGFPLNRTKRKQEYNKDDVKYQKLPPPPTPPKPVFKLRPDRTSLAPGQSQEVILEGFSEKCQQVRERMICHAIVGNNTGKEKIMKVDVIADFIEPLVNFSDRKISFFVMKHPHTELVKEVKELLLGNVSRLPLRMYLDTEYPFQILLNGQTEETSHLDLYLQVNESVPLAIQFDPDYKKDRYCRTAHASIHIKYQDHPNTDLIELTGDVFYPNLHFESDVVDFGCVLNDTEHMRNITVTNTSPLKVVFKWSFQENAINFETKEDDEGLGKDISDEDDSESKPITQAFPNLSQGKHFDFVDRPSTSPAISHLPLQMRPQTAPESTSLNSQASALPWMSRESLKENMSIQEVFDVLPLFGELEPGETQQFQFTFYGHSHSMAEAVAVCSVYGGPDYRILLKGQASLLQYAFSTTKIDLGRQLYDHVVTSEIILFNRGKVNFDFTVLDTDRGTNPQPTGITVHPSQGVVEAQQSLTLVIRFMPGLPDSFHKQFHIRVGHFEPEVITLVGEGIFPRICFDLPRDADDPRYCKYADKAKSLQQPAVETAPGSESNFLKDMMASAEKELQEEVDRLEVKDFATELVNREQDLHSALVHTTSTIGIKKLKQRARLSDYVLDFGFVNYGSVKTNSCILTNPSFMPISFTADKQSLFSTGFSIEFDKIKDLPEGESIDFFVSFDPKAGNVSLGPVEVVLPIKISSGPNIGLKLKGVVTMPDIQLSSDSIDFDSVICGQCKVVTIQMFNYTQVKCQWSASIFKDQKGKSRRERILKRRKESKVQKDARAFEMMPPSGTLFPGQRVNVQVKFMPTEQEIYNKKLLVTMFQSTYKHLLTCKGRGIEPKIEFEKLMVNFDPVLPHSHGDEQEVIVKNPSNFPIEFYCLEFDKSFLEEEKILRAMKGYDEYNTILLPPREAGSDLPKELIEAYKEMSKKRGEKLSQTQIVEDEGGEKEDETEDANEAEKKFEEAASEEDVASDHDVESDYGVGELEITPISAAIARHLGIDLSAEGKAARNRRGIAIIVHGAPLSGKSATAASIAKKYNIALLNVDDIIKEAITNGTSSAATRLRELSTIAARNAAAAAENDGLVQPGGSNEVVSSTSTGHHQGNALSMAPSTSGAIHTSFRESRKTTTQPAIKQHKQSHVSPPSSPSLGPPPSKKLSIENAPPNIEFYSCILPDDLLVEIIAEKLQSSDCQLGVVFDGLESMFTSNMTSCTNALLRAINNRKYIFAITLKLSKERLKAIDDRKKAEQARKEKEREEDERSRLEEMSEDEYEALPEEEKLEVDRKRLEEKKRRMKKKETEEQKERELREERLAEEKRLEEEKAKSTKKRVPPSQGGNRKGHEKDVKDKKHEKSNDRLIVTREATGGKDNKSEQLLSRIGTSGNQSDRSESIEDSEKRKQAMSRAGRKERPISAALTAPIEETVKPTEEEIKEKELNQRFQAFELCYRDVVTLFEAWDRTTGSISISDSEKSELDQDPAPAQGAKKGQIGHKKSEKEKEREKERDREKTKELPSPPISAMSGEHPDHSTDEDEAAKAKPQVGVPNVILQTVNPQQSMIDAVLREQILPSFDEVQDGLGLGPSGPPVPPSAIFSVVPYPRRRKPNAVNEFGASYVFVASSVDDPNAVREEKIPKSPEAEVEKTPDKKDLRSKRSRDDVTVRGSRPDRLSSGTRRGRTSMIPNQGPVALSTPPLVSSSMADDEKSINESGVNTVAAELIRHRWVVPAEGETKLRIRFSSPEVGRYDQTLNFEIVGTRRRYQLFCRGVCCFPTISREPRIVFPHRKKSQKYEEIVHKKYILSSRTFEFGPLLAGKNRDRYKEGRYPENMEQLCVSNTSQMNAEISFCYQTDTNGATFLMEPSSMALKPNESQVLNIWAYPKTPGFFEDFIVGCIKENPEPVVFKVSCHGVHPELQLDKRIIQFDKVLLYRTVTRTVFLRNSTLLPTAWRLSGMDNLGEDFSVPVDHGVIEPKTDFALHMDFRAIRPTNVKRNVRLEVSDAANVMGLARAENIQVQAEAYDVALDMSFPKGADGGLDFGTLGVFYETKQSLSLKNKGRYEISFNFAFEPTESCHNPEDLFTITPNKGTLIPSDRPTQVQVLFNSKYEVVIKDEPVLKCQIIEPTLDDPGGIIAGIPVKISVKSVYSKYSIFPVRDINFGSILVNARKTKTITIENKGEFAFKYSITKFQSTAVTGKVKGGIAPKRSQEGSSSGKSQLVPSQTKQKRSDSVRGIDVSGAAPVATTNIGATTGSGSIRFQLGMFTIFPAYGDVNPGASVQVAVDMFSELSSVSEEDIAIDISERSPQDCPGGIEYKLMGETCLPSICTLQQNVASIFEEHRIVSNLNVFRYHSHDLEPGCGVFGEEESKFVFYNVIVGHKAKARVKISNPNKVVCDVVFSVKPISNRPSARWTDVYDVEPQRAAIQPHSFSYVTITFHPSSMQSYSAVFEAAVDGLPSAVAKGRNLIFDIQGDGNLPRISIVKPISVTSKGNPLLLFNRLLMNRAQHLPLVLKNDGTLPCKVNVTLVDPAGCYTVTKENKHQSDDPDSPSDLHEVLLECPANKPVSTSLAFNSGEAADFMVEFAPNEKKRIPAELRLSVVDNPFEDAVIKLLGEGFEEEVTLDNIHGGTQDVTFADIEDENYTVPRNNHIDFGDCSVLHSSCQSFTLTNHAEADVIRFNWEPPPHLMFSPCAGHLLPNCAKDIKVTFQSPEPVKLESVNVFCKIAKIQLAKKVAKAGGWDDRMKTVRWVDVQSELNQTKGGDDGEKQMKQAGDSAATSRPAKRKVVDTEPEPSYNAIPGTATEIELLISAVADYAKYELNTNNIFFKDTLMFQSRMFSFQLKNIGDVEFNYNWNTEAGWTREPTRINHQQQLSEKNPVTRSSVMKSAKSSRESSKSRKPSLPSKGPNDSRQTSRRTPSPRGQTRQSTATTEKRSSSRIASACDGRPATAMALAYDAGGVFDEPSGNDVLPFSIEPASGSIKAGDEATFTVRFSPLDTKQYGGTLIADIPNLGPGLEQPALLLYGRSLLPWCHFELEESNYIASRRNPELKGPDGSPPGCTLDPNTKVIEFQSCGIRTKATRRFYIMNPTNTTYSFSWTNEDSQSIPSSDCPFNCLVKKGVIEAGKKTEIAFEYLPESMELQESFWRFYIQEQNVSVSFLLVGVTTDPQVSLDKSHLNFKELLIGNKGVQILNIINDEDKPFQFSFNQESLYAPGRVAHLTVTPMSGTIDAKSKLPITVEFTPENAQEVNFNLICKVKKKTAPLLVNIKAEGFRVASKLVCEDSQGGKVDLASTGVNLINLGEVEVNEKIVRQIFIENTGKFNIDFSWQIIQSQKPKGHKDAWTKDNPPVVILPDNGTVQSNSRKRCQLSFCPPCNMLLKGCELMLNIVNGSKYRLEIAGSGITPSLDFSFEMHDFGPCFIHRPGLPVPKATLIIENKESKEVGIECQFKNKPYLEVISEPGVLAPRGKMEAEICFYPRELKKYHARIPFEVNGLSTMFVDVAGQGTEMKVEVANPMDKKVNLGALRIGQTFQRPVTIINNSLAPIDFTVAITPSLPQLQPGNILTISPLSNVYLRPKEITDIFVSFMPKTRIPQFVEEVILECAGISQPLFVLSGCCHGLDIKLDSDAIPFGSVTIGSSSSRKLIMYNNGDIGAAFCWNIEKFKPDFMISPVKGYIAAGMEVTFDITFTPAMVDQDMRYDSLRCAIEGGKPLKLVLTGSCISQIPMKETINFQTHVRSRDVKNLTIHNKTNQQWLLKPVMDGEYWSGPDTISIDPQQNKNYEITYRPLTMTLENKKHTGTVFFALPDGNGLLYALNGSADAPKPTGNIQLEVPCKMPYTEILQVSNWLRKSQRFRVTIEMLKPEKSDPATTLKGLEYADVPGFSRKEYKLNFYAHKEGTFSAKVTFKNEQTLEYQFYFVQFKATAPGVISAISLSTPVRQSSSGMITINNPLQTPVNFQLNCNVQEVSFPPQRTVPPQSEQQITVEYLPMKAGEITARLSLQSSELGLYLYDLHLTATPANPERPVHFVTNLGMNQIQTCRFINYAKTKVEYSCKIENSEFLVDRSVTAASASSGGSEVGVDVTFEPTKLGDCKSILTISSNSGGEYVFPLIGHCLAPKPQGPYTIKAGGTVAIPFKNIFPQTTSFVFMVDNPGFTVKSGETIRGKKTHSITVGFEGNQGESKAVRMGRLVVSCVRSAGAANNLTWTFYLKGVTA